MAFLKALMRYQMKSESTKGSNRLLKYINVTTNTVTMMNQLAVREVLKVLFKSEKVILGNTLKVAMFFENYPSSGKSLKICQ